MSKSVHHAMARDNKWLWIYVQCPTNLTGHALVATKSRNLSVGCHLAKRYAFYHFVHLFKKSITTIFAHFVPRKTYFWCKLLPAMFANVNVVQISTNVTVCLCFYVIILSSTALCQYIMFCTNFVKGLKILQIYDNINYTIIGNYCKLNLLRHKLDFPSLWWRNKSLQTSLQKEVPLWRTLSQSKVATA